MTKPKIVFAPGCFDTFEGTQEELSELMADLQKSLDDGTFFEDARPLTPEEEEELIKELEERNKPRQ